jgi:PAS domain S-box-containing protein
MAEEQTAPVRILHVEDVEADSELVQETLRSHGIRCEVLRVEREVPLRAALTSKGIDIVLSDHNLPGWSGLDVLQVCSELRPDLPFVFVSGSIGEDRAIELLRSGATDYVLKERLTRLAPAVRRALSEADERKRRRQAEEALRESHRFVQRILDSSPNVIYVYELGSGRLVYVGGRVSLLGYAPEQFRALAGPGLYELVHPDDRARLQATRQPLAEAGPEGVVEVELRARNADGSWRWLHCREVVFTGVDGGTGQALGVAQDVTERKAVEAQLLRTQRLESIGALAGGIAHDLNNVLSPILMSVEILRRRLPPEDSRSAPLLDRVEASARRGAEMVKQILLFARGTEGERQTLDLREQLADVVKLARETFPKNISVRYERPVQLENVRGDPTQLHQVLLNLCVNARDAMPNGGSLTLSAHFERRAAGADSAALPYVRVSIADTGMGIPAELRERIFEPFFTTKPLGEGTGLGLSTSLAIVKNHGGLVDVESQAGSGSTFHIWLPATLAESEQSPAVGFSDAPKGEGELVLVVDDEEMIRDLARETLEASGYRVLCARNGQDALAVLAGVPGEVKAIVTDVAMPVMDGVALVSAVRQVAPQARLILATGQEQAAGGFPGPVLRKPFTLVELLSVLRRTLDA